MKKNIIKTLGAFTLCCFIAMEARELRTPIDFVPAAARDPHFLAGEKRDGVVGVWGKGFYRTAQDSFCCRHGTGTEPLPALFFNKADFLGRETFSGSSVTIPSNPWMNISTLSPRFRYTERGAVIGAMVAKCVREGKLRLGVRAQLPFCIVDVDRIERCGQLSGELGGERLDDVVVYRPEAINDLGATAHGLVNYAYRLDFLSALRLGAIGGAADMPFVDYRNTAFPNNPITIANQNITRVGGSAPAFVTRRDNGTAPEQFYQFQTFAGTAVNGSASNLSNSVSGHFVQGTDYTPLGDDVTTQRTLWIVPGIVQQANSVNQRPEAIVIQKMLDALLPVLDDSAEDFFARQHICFASQCCAGIGDLETEFFVSYLPSEKTYIEGVVGLVIPTAQELNDPKKLLKMPIGNNGHLETKLALYGGWKPLSWFQLKADASYSFVHTAKECVAAPFRGAIVKNIGPPIKADVRWGYFLGEVDFVFYNPEDNRLGVTAGYQLYAKLCDKICFCKQTAQNILGHESELNPALLACRTNVISHKGHFDFFCRMKNCEFFIGWQHVFAGRNAMKETIWHLGLTVGF